MWASNLQTQDLIDEVKAQNRASEPIVSTRGGTGSSTYVVKELVYAYAMWISPKFHLKVIRAYDQLQTEGVAVADHAADDLIDNPLDYMEKLLGQAKQLKAERLHLS
ncbi:hypothetical protein GCM10017767_33530 [Halomonas urumqiensis]|nr:hypothetical protein GCM10017767_33530 [Halomonas urumqiensis]